MSIQGRNVRIQHHWHWLIGAGAFLWVLLRSGANPKRLTYPCQRAAIPLAANWLLAILAFVAGSLFFRRFVKISSLIILIAGTIWFIGSLPEFSTSEIQTYDPLPVWEVYNPVSRVFIMDKIPLTSGSLAAGNASVPDEYLSDPAIDTLIAVLDAGGTFFYETVTQPEGIVGRKDIVIIKGNFQWTHQNTTSPDRIKGLIWRILNHPDGFLGEIIVCDNTQDIGTGINEEDDNSEDPDQSILDVVNTFSAKGYPVYLLDWNSIWDDVAAEYSQGDMNDGYIYEADTRISYPKFRSPSGNQYISLRRGIWDPLTENYDPSRLCIIDFPVLKGHGMAGATIAVKNWIGVLTTAFADERYGDWGAMHYRYFFTSYALVARVMAATFPALTIVDATWTNAYCGANTFGYHQNTRMLVASTDPVAASWYAAKYILTPIAQTPGNTDPDRPGSDYGDILEYWTNYLRNTEGMPCTNDSSEISVTDRTILDNPAIWFTGRTIDDSQENHNGRADSGESVNLIVTLTNSSQDATGIMVTLANDDPDVELIQTTAGFGDLARGEQVSNESAPFSFSINEGTTAHMSTFHLHITADGGYEKTIDFELLVGTPTLLLVDDDGGKTYEPYYTAGLHAKLIYPEVWEVQSQGVPEPGTLLEYQAVVWFTGNDRTGTLTSAEQAALGGFLDQGGRLILAGQNIGYDLVENGSPGDATFFTDYLHAEYISDTIDETFVCGIAGDPISGDFPFLSLDAQTSPSVIAPLEEATPVLLYQISRQVAAIRYEGDYKLVYFALGLEGLGALVGDDNVARGNLLEHALQWLAYAPAPGDVTEDGSINVLDVLFAVNIILGVVEPTPTQEWAADCNGDGTINVIDVIGIINVILGIGTCPPAGTVGIGPAARDYLRSLESYLSADDFIRLMYLANEVERPQSYVLFQNYPNPFNATTTIAYSLPVERRKSKVEREGTLDFEPSTFHVTLKVYNLLGQEVCTLVDGVQEAGLYTVRWDGKDRSGREVASGIYVYRLKAGQYAATRQMAIIK